MADCEKIAIHYSEKCDAFQAKVEQLQAELKLCQKNFCVAHQPLPEDSYEGCYACDMMQLQAEVKLQYRKGYEDGLRAYAWWKDGVQYVGTCGTTLKEALNSLPNEQK